jgi:hypothetical protein
MPKQREREREKSIFKNSKVSFYTHGENFFLRALTLFLIGKSAKKKEES